ncbi:hypothetical protein ACAH01_06665 [Halomicrobium sp. HM KBTZ05]|uniref:hypothetical protein n=1 Tax=Halomicrobium sp. HM KBTZ05 TaxID=3242663 RepID=UPI003558E1AF
MATDTLRRYQDPEYTGSNRCLPCTLVNSVIGILLSGGIAAVGATWATTAVGVAGAGVVLLLSAVSIYFKGYLVPGTPALTKRYFPPWLLALFGKEPAGAASRVAKSAADPAVREETEEPAEIDLETYLMEAGALEPCRGGEDLCLTDPFQTEWNEAIERIRDADVGRERLPALLDTTAEEVTVEEHGSAFRARVDGQYVGTWESRGAFVADIAAAEVLGEWLDDWASVPVTHRGQLLNGLRLFLTTCPSCGGDLAFGTDTVESCCTTHEVAAVSCEDCETRVFESDPVD